MGKSKKNRGSGELQWVKSPMHGSAPDSQWQENPLFGHEPTVTSQSQSVTPTLEQTALKILTTLVEDLDSSESFKQMQSALKTCSDGLKKNLEPHQPSEHSSRKTVVSAAVQGKIDGFVKTINQVQATKPISLHDEIVSIKKVEGALKGLASISASALWKETIRKIGLSIKKLLTPRENKYKDQINKDLFDSKKYIKHLKATSKLLRDTKKSVLVNKKEIKEEKKKERAKRHDRSKKTW